MGRSTKIYGPKLKKAREDVFLTQSQLGAALDGMSDENISRIERSAVAGILTKQLPALAAALKMPMDVFKETLVAPASFADPIIIAKEMGRLAKRIASKEKIPLQSAYNMLREHASNPGELKDPLEVVHPSAPVKKTKGKG